MYVIFRKAKPAKEAGWINPSFREKVFVKTRRIFSEYPSID
jgi:hypothetical protein